MNNLTELNYGQIILYGYICTSLEGRLESELPLSTLSEIIEAVIELTDVDLYENIEDCPDHQIMVNPSESFNIFCDFWDENENYFLSLTH
jgi:hypothetical protein